MILEIPVVEKIHYALRLEINDDLWKSIQRCRVPLEVLTQLIEFDAEERDGSWFATQVSEANCASCIDCSTKSVHAMRGVEERYIEYARSGWIPAKELETYNQVDPAAPIPYQQEFAREFFGAE